MTDTIIQTGVAHTSAAHLIRRVYVTGHDDRLTVAWSTRPIHCDVESPEHDVLELGPQNPPRLQDATEAGAWELFPLKRCEQCGTWLKPAAVLRDGHLDEDEISELAEQIAGTVTARLDEDTQQVTDSLTDELRQAKAALAAGADEDDVLTGSDLTPGVVRDGDTLLAWAYDPTGRETEGIVVTEREL